MGVGPKTPYGKVPVLALITPDKSAEYKIEGRAWTSKCTYEILENRAWRLTRELDRIGVICESSCFQWSWEAIDLGRAALKWDWVYLRAIW